MNRLHGVIATLHRSDSIVLVEIDAEGERFSALMIEGPHAPPWLRSGIAVGMLFKETELVLARDVAGSISITNRLSCSVLSVTRGTVLTTVELMFHGHTLTSAITTLAADALSLSAGITVSALINASEIILQELRPDR